MDNQHREISGYRDLTRIEVDLMNQAKNMGGTLGAFIEALEKVEAVDKR